MPCGKLGKPGSKGGSNWPLLLSNNQIDMSYLRLFSDKSLTN
jgi:hypothetical protein